MGKNIAFWEKVNKDKVEDPTDEQGTSNKEGFEKEKILFL